MALVIHRSNELSGRVIGAAIEVHRHLGPGLLESSYQVCLQRELELRGITARKGVALPLEYKGVSLPKGYVIDLVVADALIVEVKSVEALLPVHQAQIITYMRLMRIGCGLLMNFNTSTLTQGIRRVLL